MQEIRPESNRKPPTTYKPMPLYEYVCRKCRNEFAEVLTAMERDQKKIHCSTCQSVD